MDKLKLSSLAGKNVKWHRLCRKLAVPKNGKQRLSIQSALLLVYIRPK